MEEKRKELSFFDAAFEDIVELVCENPTLVGDNNGPEVAERFRRVLKYNVPHGKKTRGLTVVRTFEKLRSSQHSSVDRRNAQVLGWCIEFLQAYFLVADDIMDNSTSRRGKPCWYKVPEVGMIAVNDALFMDSSVTLLLKLHFKNHPQYVELIELFDDAKRTTIIGQNLDTCTPLKFMKERDLSLFTQELYDRIVHNKTAIYSFYLPVAAAMLLTGYTAENQYETAKSILLKIGHFFQVQDDYLDCYGNPAVTGKIGTDIEDGKCTWFIIKAMDLANSDERSVLKEHYGKPDKESVDKVKEVFNSLELEKCYKEYEEKTYDHLIGDIKNITTLPKEIFYELVHTLFKRNA